MLNIAREEEEMKRKEEEMKEQLKNMEKLAGVKKQLEEQNVVLQRQKDDMYLELQTAQDAMIEHEERIEQLLTEKQEFESQLKEMEEKLLDEEDAAHEMEDMKNKMAQEADELKKDIEDLEGALTKVRWLWTDHIFIVHVFSLFLKRCIC